MGGVRFRGLFYKRCAHPPNRRKTPTRRRPLGARPAPCYASEQGAHTPARRHRANGESGVRRLRPRAFLCGVGGYSPPSALLETAHAAASLIPARGLAFVASPLDRASAPADNATNSPPIGERLAAATRAVSAAYGRGIFVRCRGLLAPVRFAWSCRVRCSPNGWPNMRGYFQQPRIFHSPVGWGPHPRGRAHALRPVCPPHPFSLAAANSATARGNISLSLALRSFVIQRVRASLARFSFLTRSATCRPLGGRQGEPLPAPPPPRSRGFVVASAPCAALAPLALRAPVFRLRVHCFAIGGCVAPNPSPPSLSSGLSPAVRESVFLARTQWITLIAVADLHCPNGQSGVPPKPTPYPFPEWCSCRCTPFQFEKDKLYC